MNLPAKCSRLAVIGNGIIGHGVAQVFAMSGTDVVLIGRSDPSLAAAMGKIRDSLGSFAAHGLVASDQVDTILARIATTTRLEQAEAADLVIEAVTEDLALKRDLFGKLDRLCRPETVRASSSGQPASALIQNVNRKEMVIAAHFWYPPQLIPLVEVCGGPDTAPEVVAWTSAALRATGKEPAVIDREIPGFIGNRLQFALLREAWSLWAKGVASPEAIDAVVRTSFGRRLAITGPLESADVGGLFTMYHFARSLFPDLETSAAPPDQLEKLVASGANGASSGRGVHDWSERDGKALVARRMEELFRWMKHDRGTAQPDA